MSRQVDCHRALLDAILLDDLPAVARALSQGADINARDAEHQETPLMLARSEAAARLLLNHGADVNARDDQGRTAFMSRRWPLLMSHGSDINARGANGETALMKAVMDGDTRDVEQVLALGANPDIRDNNGRTALDIATSYGFVAIVECLETIGADDTKP